jgi:hypothetical protein
MKRHLLLGIVLALVVGSSAVAGEEKAAKPYRIAVLPFEASKVEAKTWGNEVADLLSALLATKENLQLVERGDLEKLIKEHGLNLTGLTTAEDQLKLGKLSGAQFLIIGRMFPIDRDICIVAKVVGVETSKVSAVVAQGPLSDKLAPVVTALAEKVSAALNEKADALLPRADVAKDTVQTIKDAIAKDKTEGPRAGVLPRFLVSVNETHSRPVRDPASATELLIIAKDAGFSVVDAASSKQALSEWAVRFLKDTDTKLPIGADTADVVLVGEGISEFGTRTGDLITCVGRLELQAVDVRTGKVLSVGRKTSRATDLTETIAAKTALEAAAKELAPKLFSEAVIQWRAAGNVKEEKK